MMIERNLLALMLTNRLDPAMADIEEKHFSDFTHNKLITVMYNKCKSNAQKT